MVIQTVEAAPSLYEADEVAWLEAMADLIRAGRHSELDYENLSEYLSDMAISERREVRNRLAVLLAHLLKWEHQPTKRSGSWRATILVQRAELSQLVGRGVLRKHAEAVLAQAYADAVTFAAAETELPVERFPAQCPYTLQQVLSEKLHG